MFYFFFIVSGQVKAGAQMLQVFESHAEHLDHDLFAKFCLPFLTQICSRVKTTLKNCGIEPVPMVGMNYVPI